jgi:hypothetical protein
MKIVIMWTTVYKSAMINSRRRQGTHRMRDITYVLDPMTRDPVTSIIIVTCDPPICRLSVDNDRSGITNSRSRTGICMRTKQKS